MQFADRVSSGVVGSVGFALLLWTLLGTIKKVEDSFNFVWRVEQPRSFARRIAEYLMLLIIGPILLVGFIGLSHVTMSSSPVQMIAGLPLGQRFMQLGFKVAPYAMVTSLFTVLYMFVPNTRVQIRSALIGALAAGVIWAAVGKMFTGMVVLSTRLTIVYAGFAVIVAVLLWTYFGWLILLAGAQLSFYVQNPSYLKLGLEELRLSSSEVEELALKTMFLVGKSHTDGGKRWTVNALAHQVGLPGIAIAEIANTLEKAGLLIVTEVARFWKRRAARAADTLPLKASNCLRLSGSQRNSRKPGARAVAIARCATCSTNNPSHRLRLPRTNRRHLLVIPE
jgi:membrane protein